MFLLGIVWEMLWQFVCVCIWTICRQAAYFFGLKQSWCRETKFQVFVLMSTVLRLLNNCCKPCVWYSDSSPEHTVRTQRAQRSVDTTGQLYLIIDHYWRHIVKCLTLQTCILWLTTQCIVPDIINMNLVIGKVPENYKHDASKQYATYPSPDIEGCLCKEWLRCWISCSHAGNVCKEWSRYCWMLGNHAMHRDYPWGMPMCEHLMQDVFIHSKDFLRAWKTIPVCNEAEGKNQRSLCVDVKANKPSKLASEFATTSACHQVT